MTQLAEKLGVSKGYISQLLKGEFNHSLKKLIELLLFIGLVPRIEYKTVARVIKEDIQRKAVRAFDVNKLAMVEEPRPKIRRRKGD